MSDIDRLPPHSIEAEEAVLGSLLIDPDAIYEVSTFLKPESFYREQNRWIYEAILELYDKREPLDFITLSELLRQRGQLDDIGGEAYLIDLLNAVPTSVNAQAYGRLVENAGVRRNLIRAASAIANLAYDEAEDVEVIVDRAEQALFGVSEERTTRDLTPIKHIAREFMERIERLRELGDDVIGVPTGFVDLDRLLGGLNKSDLIIVAARPGMGKTSLILSMALTAARRYNKRVAIFNLEMSGEQMLMRMLAAETQIDSQRLRRGKIYESEMPIFLEAIGRLSETNVYIDDTPGMNPRQMRTKCRRLYAERGIDLILVDYLQLMSSDRSNNNRVMEISEISRGLKLLARELDVPVIAAAQLSRAVESRQDKRPMLSDLRDSGCLTGETLITLADSGQRIPIAELEGHSNFAIWAINQNNWKLERAIVSNAFSTGEKPVFKLTTRLGRSIRATGNHPFLAFDGWKRLDALETSERIALPSTNELQQLAASDVYWDQIVSIEPDGVEKVYDLTVPRLHNFVANDIIVHNSIEQDADIVAFIYRDEYYNPETTERPGIAEISVAKHRNGPTGIIDLFWHSELATFKNLQRQEVNL